MNWMPLPFPKCPQCSKSWSMTYHRNCPHKSEIEVNAISNSSRCKPCNIEWPTLGTIFYCTCGYSFSGKEVESAIKKTLELKEKLTQFLREMGLDEQNIERTTKESFVSWLTKSSYEIGKGLGSIAGRIIGIIAKIFS